MHSKVLAFIENQVHEKNEMETWRSKLLG